MKYKILACAIFLISISFASHLPQPTGYVNDFAGILTDPQGLENTLRMYEQNTTIEIAVVTISGLPHDQTLFSYGVELFQEWGIGKSDDNGILVLINKEHVQGNRLRIELGYGVQGYITGAEAGSILDDALPFYEQGDYQLAAEIILNSLSEELVDYVPGQTAPRSDEPEFIFSFGFSGITALVLAGFLYAFMKHAPSDRSKKMMKISLAIVPVLFVISLFSMIFMFVFFVGAIIFLIASSSYFMRPRCPRCKSTSIKYTYSSDSPVVRCACKKCGKTWRKRQPGYYRGGVFIATGGGGFGGGGGGGGFGGGGSGGGGAGR